MKLWIGRNYMRGAIALLLLCGTLFLTAGVLAYGTDSPAGLLGISSNPETTLRPFSNFLAMETAVQQMDATVATDRPEYAPGQTAIINGSGFMAGETVILQVTHVGPTGSTEFVTHQGHDPWEVVADSAGNIEGAWLVDEDSLNQTLRLTADGTSSGSHASTTFTDSIGYGKGVYNKDDFPPGSTGDWTTGNAGDNYLEDQWVSYQYQVAGITGTTPSFDISFNHFQENTEAIFVDAFTNFRACVDCTEDTYTSGPKEGMLLDDHQYPSTSTTNWKSALPAISLINGTLDANGACVATEDPVNDPSQFHCFHVNGPALQALFPGTNFNSGAHTITLFYESHLSSSFTWRAGMGGTGHEYLMGCSSSSYYVAPPPEAVPAAVFGTDAYSGGDPCLLDSATDWSAPFKGVGSATGSSRHFNIVNQTAGSNGGLTLPIPTVMAPTGSITIIKQTSPSPAVGAVFGFSSDALGNFNLDTDPSATNPSQITFTDLPGGAKVLVTEGNTPTWSLTNLVCTGDAVFTTDLGSATASITLNNTAGASATCTFTNTQQLGTIRVVKNAVPNNAQDFTFNDNFGNGNPASFLLDDDSNATLPNFRDFSVIAGTFAVSEVPAGGGWELTSATCDDGSPVSAIVVSPGETVTCTFTNTNLNLINGRIIVVKDTVPNDSQLFTFTPSYNGGTPFQLSDGQSNDSCGAVNCLAEGLYSVSETANAAYSTTSSCDDGSPTSAIDLQPGETVTCTFVNRKPAAQIDLSPLTATNRVNEPHTITATVQQDDTYPAGAPGDPATGFGPAPNGILVTFSLLNNVAGATFVGGVNTCTTSGGTGTCSVTINTTTAGGVDIHATTTFSVLGVSFTVATGTGGLNSADAHKTYVDAQIDVTPLDATNRVNEPHTITATVQQDDGLPAGAPGDSATGFGPAPDGTTVTFSFVSNTAGAFFVGGDNDCTTTGGSCSIQINSSSAGVVVVQATTTFSVGGLPITRTTGTGGLNSGNARKVYVDAQIDVTPLTATNRVNEPHTITATVQQDDGLPAGAPGDAVTGFGPAPNGTVVTFSFVTNTAGATFVGGVGICNTLFGGSCSIQINAPNAGLVVVQATTTFTVGGLSITRTTGTGGLNSAHASKVYVDAKIGITPLVDTNPINEAHTFTATVQQDDGLPAGAPGDPVTGFGPAPNGTLVTFSFVQNTIGAVFVGGINTCTTTAGSCTVQINSSAPGVLIVGATTTFNVGGLSLTRTTGTGGLNSANAQKTYVAGNIIVRKLTAPTGSSQSFEFDPSYAVNFFLQHGQQNDSGNLAPGTYSVAEVNIPAGWDLSSATCDDGSSIGSISLQANETVTCTFTNTKRPRLKLVKTVTNNNGGTKVCNDWDLMATGAGGFTELTPCLPNATFRDVQIGVNYALTETAVHGYAPTGNFSCDGGTQVGNSVSLAAGSQVTCTINNDDQAPQICVRKFTDPANSPTVFNFATTGTGYTGFGVSGVTAGNANRNCQSVDAGTYSAQETVPANWMLTGIGTFGQAGTACTVTSNDALPAGASSGSGNLATMTASMVLLVGDTVTCDFENTAAVGGVTRTQGFWSTHSPLAYIAWFGGTAYGHTFPGVAATAGIGDRSLCGRDIGPADLTGLGKLMGGFWSDIAKKSTGGKRSAIDKARMTLLQQLLAAELNASAFGSNPPGGSGQFAVWEAAFCGTDVTAINTARGQADAFNNSGDNGSFTPGTSADAQYAKSIANKPFWDNPAALRGIFASTPTTTGDGESIITSPSNATGDGE